MKKWILFTLVAFASLRATAQCGTVFFDGFESGSYTPTWTLGTGLTSAAVVNVGPAMGTYCLQGIGGNSSHLTGLNTTIPAVTPSTISWYMKPSTAGAAQGYVVMGNNAVSATNCIFFAYFQGSSNTIRFISSTTQTYPANVGDWYFIELRNVNYTAHTFDIWINNALVATGYPFRSASQNDISRIALYNFGSATAYWDNINLGGTPVMSLSETHTDVLCNGDSTGTVNLTVSGVNPAFTYLWSNGATTEDLSNIPAGSYEVMVTDNIGCDDSLTVNITEPTAINASLVTTDLNCNGDSSGAIDLTASGGTAGYTYLWSNSDATEDLMNLNAGTYMVTITDGNSCTHVAMDTVSEPPALMVLDSLVQPACAGMTGSVTALPQGGTPGYSYLWSNGSMAQGQTGLAGGTYQVTVTDANGCTATHLSVINTLQSLAISDSLTDVLCFGGNTGSILLSASGGTPAYSYLWNTGDTTASLAGLVSGNYLVTVVDANGCTAVDSFTIVEAPELNVSSSITDAIGANNGAIDLTVSGGSPGFTFAWSNNATTEDISGLAAGNYFVTITDANGCTSVHTFTVDFFASAENAWAGTAVSAFPNPFGNEFVLRFESHSAATVQVNLYSLAGAQVMRPLEFAPAPGLNDLRILTPDLPAGIYLWEIRSHEGIVRGKIVKTE